MFVRSGWNYKKYQKLLSVLVPVPPAALPNIHEEPTQSIQGGAVGDHYHVTAAELDNLQHKEEHVMIACEILISGEGEPVMIKVAA